eukprot:m.140913 g.140913  ORF g.140913 m.140913 type:complete len:166 (+) comp10018_c0_seq6:3616-4113(+)
MFLQGRSLSRVFRLSFRPRGLPLLRALAQRCFQADGSLFYRWCNRSKPEAFAFVCPETATPMDECVGIAHMRLNHCHSRASYVSLQWQLLVWLGETQDACTDALKESHFAGVFAIPQVFSKVELSFFLASPVRVNCAAFEFVPSSEAHQSFVKHRMFEPEKIWLL